jgi:hypothetical protein
MDYPKLAATALRLIAATGRVVTFERLVSEPADPSKPWRGAQEQGVDATLSQAATFVPPTGAGLGKETVTPEMLARVQQVCLVGPNATFDLNRTTAIVDGGVKWMVDWVYELKPADVSLLFAIGVKR